MASIILDPNKSFIQIDTFYVEEIKRMGPLEIIKHHFIRSQDELEEWTGRGYSMPQQGTENQDDEKTIKKLSTKWKRLTWKEQNVILSSCFISKPSADGKLITSMDGMKFREMKLKTCLKDWDILDSYGNKIPITEENIDNMVPEVANELIDSFEKLTEPTGDDLKK